MKNQAAGGGYKNESFSITSFTLEGLTCLHIFCCWTPHRYLKDCFPYCIKNYQITLIIAQIFVPPRQAEWSLRPSYGSQFVQHEASGTLQHYNMSLHFDDEYCTIFQFLNLSRNIAFFPQGISLTVEPNTLYQKCEEWQVRKLWLLKMIL